MSQSRLAARFAVVLVFTSAVILGMAGCSTRPSNPYQSYPTNPRPTNPAPSAFPGSSNRSTPPVPIAEPDEPSATSSFSDPEDNRAAQAAIDKANTTFESVKQAAALFSPKRPSECDDPRFAAIQVRIVEIEDSGERFASRILTTADLDEREAFMDVSDELIGLALDSYIEVAGAYKKAKCFSRAKFLLNEIQRIYVGEAFTNWRDAAVQLLAEIQSAEKAATPITKAPKAPTSTPAKKKIAQ